MPPGYIKRGNLPMGTRGFPIIEFKAVGSWDAAIRMVQRLGPNIKQASLKAQMKVAKEIVKRVKKHLRAQDLGWAPLSEEYAQTKAAFGLDPRTLWSHGTYYAAIEAWQSGSQHIVFAGVKKGKYAYTVYGKKSKVEIARVAAMHEFSSGKRFPRRPLWNPTIREIGGMPGLKAMYLGSLLYHLRMAGVPIKPFKNLF